MRLDVSESSLWCFHPCSCFSREYRSTWSLLWFRYVTLFSGLALPTWLFDFSLLWLFDFTDLPFSLIVATCSFITFILLFLSESLILWVLLDALLVELWPIEILFVFSSQLFWMISLCIILSFDFNSELVRSAIVVRNLFVIWSFDFGSSCSWSIILIYYFEL